MGIQIERKLKQAKPLDPMPREILTADILDIQRYQQQFWAKMSRELAESGDPIMLNSPYGAPVLQPPAQQISTTSVNGEVGLWAAASYSSIPANSAIAPQEYRLHASGQCTTSTSPGNSTWTPRLGTSTSGTALGASGAVPLTASITNSLWTLQGNLTIRSIGTAGTAIATFLLHHRHAIAGVGDFITTTSSGTGQQIFGYTAASSIDFTAAQGLFMGMANTVTTITWKVDQVHFIAFN